MRSLSWCLACLLLAAVPARADQPPRDDPLLDHLVGTWVLRGTIAGQSTTHDVVSKWVLGHQYVRLVEVSREKGAKGRPAYEAEVFVGWDQAAGEYACLWLDSTGGDGLAPQSIARAKRDGDRLAFLFKDAGGGAFHTTFTYDKTAGTWDWTMDAEQDGKLQPFARVTLRKPASGVGGKR